MKTLSIFAAVAAVAIVGYGTTASARRTAPGSGHWEMVRGLDDAFRHTANLRGGTGRCGAGHARKPGVPGVFHVEARERQDLPKNLQFTKDEMSGLYSLNVAGDSDAPFGSRYYEDAAKKQAAGHFLLSSGSKGDSRWAKVDAQYLAGDYRGTAYRSLTTTNDDGAGNVKASGTTPKDGAYELIGCWSSTNAGSWSQSWTLAKGGAEKDVYRTTDTGSARMTVATSAGLNLDLAFAADRSGKGTVSAESGLAGKVEWNAEGDGTIAWSDGSSQAFEDWRI